MFKVPATNCPAVAPGWSYDTTTEQFLPCPNGEDIESERQPFRLEFDIEVWDEKKIEDQKENEAFWKEKWVKDYIKEEATDAILIKGFKVEEERGIGIPTDSEVHKVVSVYYKYKACFLMLSMKKFSETSVNELNDYLQDVKNDSIKSSAPITRCKQSKCIYIYGDTGKEMKILHAEMLGLVKFADHLKASKVSLVPECALIQSKGAQNVDLPCLEASQSENSNGDQQDLHNSQSENSNGDQQDLHNKNITNISKCNILKEFHDEKKSLFEESGEHDVKQEFSSATEKVTSTIDNDQLKDEKTKQSADHCKHIPANDNIAKQEGGSNNIDDRSQHDNENSTKDMKKICSKGRIIKEPQLVNPCKEHRLLKRDKNGPSCMSQKDPATKDTVIKTKNDLKTREKLSEGQKNLDSKDDSEDGSCKKRKHLLADASSQKKMKSALGLFTLDDDDDYQIFPKIDEQTSAKGRMGEKKKEQKNMKSTLLRPTSITDDPCGFQRKYYGTVNDMSHEKVLLLLGASGSGKTMLVNFIANYFMEKKTVDEELIHVEPTNPTTSITAYTFCQAVDNVPITIIDTPGLNDASGAEVRDHVKTLKTFLANVSAKGYDIHAIGFVAQAHLVRLTSSERLVMDYVSTMFGECVSDHLITLITFADNQNMPPIIEAMKNYGVNFKLSLKFNNSALSNSITEEMDDLDRVYWRVCRKNWNKCMATLCNLPPLSVNAMKAVQNEIYLSTVIQLVKKEINAELTSFFTFFREQTCPSKEALKVCDKIWNLAAIIHHHRQVQENASITSESIITEFAQDICQTQNLDPGQYIHLLALSEATPLVVSGREIIKIMAPLYREAKWYRNSCSVAKNMREWSYCYQCDSEHKMMRCDARLQYQQDKIILKCISCKCPGDCHRPSKTELPFNEGKILQKTLKSLRKAIMQYSIKRFPIPEKLFITFLNQHLYCEHEDFLRAVYELMK